mmetsp:Transcript_12779/g.23792  ORF Transcript_12779/g.23792 Transcript_12779/m.23792 type:complete len:181 (+) Transcript_12779:732-1274(+)
MLSATISLDCVGFDQSLKNTRWVDLDFDSFNSLEGKVEDYEALTDSKFDIQANLDMGLLNMLRKDYAEVQVGSLTIGFSSVVTPLESLLTLDLEDLDRFISNKSAVVVLSFNTKPEPKRQILVYTRDTQLLERISAKLEEDTTLDTSPIEISIPNSKAYNQRNVGPSRKYILPLIRNALS